MYSSSSRKRLVLLYAVAISIPLFFFVLLEAGLRLFEYGDTQRLFIPGPKAFTNQPYLMTNRWVAYRYFPKQQYVPQPPEEFFLQNKPENGYRIFVLGGSTTAGWPYPENVLFSRILKQRLADVFPDKYIEVINTGIAAINSFTMLDFIDEILEQKPDAILVYAGHNEFYGALGAASTESFGRSRWIINGYLRLLRLKTVQLIRDMVNTIAYQSRSSSAPKHATLMGRMIGDRSIPYGSPVYQAAKANYETNLRDLFTIAKEAGVPVVISELVSNLRDQRPFVPVEDGQHLPADIFYAWAQQLEQEQMFDMAKTAYAWAKDLDGLRFRAPEEFNVIIHKLAAEFEIPVVPMKSYFERESPHGIVGANLMLEHLHPNADGYQLMSEAFFDTMREHKFISDTWDDEKIIPADVYRRNWPITDFDRALGMVRIVNLTDHWPFPPKVEGESTITNFQPASKAEELAIKEFKGEISYLVGHLEMARYYESNGEDALAMREYYALISAAPYNANAYFPAIQALLAKKEFDRALLLLIVSKQLRESGEANRWIGQIYMHQRRPPGEVLPFLEKALSFQPNDIQTLFNLVAVKLASADFESARYYLERLERLKADPRKIELIKERLDQKNPG